MLTMLEMHAVRPLLPSEVEGAFFSNMFVVNQGARGPRPCIDLRDLNAQIRYHHFKMEGLHTLQQLIRPKDYLTKVDLSKAYWHVPIYGKHQKQLAFVWKGQSYCFRVLPFGLASAPRTFQKLMLQAIKPLRRRGIRLVLYLDDILLMASTEAQSRKLTQLLLTCLTERGFRVNLLKSCLVPCHSQVFLGFTACSATMTLSLPQEKVKAIYTDAKRALRTADRIPIRQLASVIGKMRASSPAVMIAPLRSMHLMHCKRMALRQQRSYAGICSLTQEAKTELEWWMHELSHWTGVSVMHHTPVAQLTTDASPEAWGATLTPMPH
jgi:hypothetical protein